MTVPSISVVFPTYGRCDVVRTTIERLLASDYPADRFEILVCDNSSDGTPDMVRSFAAGPHAPVHLLASDERLPAVKRNQGLRRATGDLVLFMNDDLWVEPDLLAEHARAHETHDGPVAVLGHVRQSPAMDWTPFVEWYQPFAYSELDGREGEGLEYRYFWSMNLSLPRATMLERNLVFHEDWRHIGHEDVELGHRWCTAGMPLVYHPAATGEHYHPHTVDSACRLQASVGRGLRDLESLVDDDGLLERYGIFSWHSSGRAVLRGLAREALFNRVTVPPVQRWLSSRTERSRASDWLYWKVLLHHTNRAYRNEAPRHVPRTPTRGPSAEAMSA